jgi:hypothetical protein
MRLYCAPLDYAGLAQLVEHLLRKQGVRCSNHLSGTILSVDLTKYQVIVRSL